MAEHDDRRIDPVNRRTFLRRLGIAGGTLAVTSRLGAAPALAQAETPSPLKVDPAAKRGGTLRYGMHSASAHFDIHQSGTVANIGPQGPMYDNLIRRDPRDGQTIIPDLAWKWDISKDGKVYTFFLRKGVKFHDGGDFTAEDVKATFQRIVSPPKGVVIPRTPLFATVSDIRVIDPHKIEFRLSEPRPAKFILGAFASGWNVIVRKKTLDEHGGNLRQVMNFPGTGPFKHVSRVDKEIWTMERNPNYWNRGLPYLDKLEIYAIPPFDPANGSALLAGKLDYGRLLDPVSARKIQGTQGMTATDFYQTVIQAVFMNNKKKPFTDPRVRRAFNLALDKHVLVDVVKDVAPMMVGGFIYPFSEWASPSAEMAKRLGYQKDPGPAVQEARKLMAAAGYANGVKDLDFLVRDIATFRLWSVAIQAMLKETINVECKLRVAQASAWFDDAEKGNFDIGISAIVSTLLDPSDYFNAWYGKGGPQNYSQWENPPFHDITKQIDSELDDTKRKALVRKAEDILEQDPPVLPVSWEKIYDGWYSYVKGVNPYKIIGIYDVVRWDTAWLAK